jgi:hypothetical protein
MTCTIQPSASFQSRFATRYGIVLVTIWAGESRATLPSAVTQGLRACSASMSMRCTGSSGSATPLTGNQPPEVGFNHGSNARKLRRAVKGRDGDRVHPGAGKQRGQLLPIPEDEWRTQGIGGSLTRHPLKQRHLGRVCRPRWRGSPRRRRPDGLREPRPAASRGGLAADR